MKTNNNQSCDNWKIAVIIPALNEELAIGSVITEIPGYVDKIIVVDNGSTDRTTEKAKEAGAEVVFESRTGYGYACMKGIKQAINHNLLVFLDGDYSDFPEDIAKLVEPIMAGTADLVLGSRIRGEREKGSMFPQSIIANMAFSIALRILCGLRITDIGPFRAIRYDQLVLLGMEDVTYGWTLEMMIKSKKKHLRIAEVPVNYRKRLGKSKISGSFWASIKAATKMVYTFRYIFKT